MKYPDKDTLIALGEWAIQSRVINQAVIDEKIKRLIA
jgi:hypothetical protein